MSIRAGGGSIQAHAIPGSAFILCPVSGLTQTFELLAQEPSAILNLARMCGLPTTGRTSRLLAHLK